MIPKLRRKQRHRSRFIRAYIVLRHNQNKTVTVFEGYKTLQKATSRVDDLNEIFEKTDVWYTWDEVLVQL